MSKEKNYSWNELVITSNDIDAVLKNNRDKEDKDGKLIRSGVDRILAFKLRTNQKKANSAVEQSEEDFPDKDDKYDEFVKEKIEIAKEFGGKIEESNGRIMVTNYNEIMGNKDFTKKMEKLEDDYKEVIDQEDERQKTINRLRREKTIPVEWTNISLDLFPEEISGEDLPLSFIEFVTFSE